MKGSKGVGSGARAVHEAYRKPDLILTSLRAATRAAGEELTWMDTAAKRSFQAPELRFPWTAALVSIEIKRVKNQVACPSSYHMYEATDERKVNVDPWYDIASGSSPASKSDGPISRKRKSEETRSDSPKRSRNTRSSSQASSGLSSTPEIPGAIGYTVEQEPDKLPPVIQCGVYASEMMSQRGAGTHRATVMLMEGTNNWQSTAEPYQPYTVDEKLWLFVYDREGDSNTRTRHCPGLSSLRPSSLRLPRLGSVRLRPQ
ncbi:hypothetical protein FA95DRAFT_484249 [Auriscalpium vulgare]|uniref:Uncharacterized protein n=1 Tax=Auriscalpium vulgare TaxID=40419 RepID=A0ACB8SC06_9AGAM|nr:hypothetical protein FA95DRAFT_484249 [Auriscalpium vulgare]